MDAYLKNIIKKLNEYRKSGHFSDVDTRVLRLCISAVLRSGEISQTKNVYIKNILTDLSKYRESKYFSLNQLHVIESLIRFLLNNHIELKLIRSYVGSISYCIKLVYDFMQLDCTDNTTMLLKTIMPSDKEQALKYRIEIFDQLSAEREISFKDKEKVKTTVGFIIDFFKKLKNPQYNIFSTKEKKKHNIEKKNIFGKKELKINKMVEPKKVYNVMTFNEYKKKSSDIDNIIRESQRGLYYPSHSQKARIIYTAMGGSNKKY